jgi:hypothetical protein
MYALDEAVPPASTKCKDGVSPPVTLTVCVWSEHVAVAPTALPIPLMLQASVVAAGVALPEA